MFQVIFILVNCLSLLLEIKTTTCSPLLSYTLFSSLHLALTLTRVVSRSASECRESLFRNSVSSLWAARSEDQDCHSGCQHSHPRPSLLPPFTSCPYVCWWCPSRVYLLAVTEIVPPISSNIPGLTLPHVISCRSCFSMYVGDDLTRP